MKNLILLLLLFSSIAVCGQSNTNTLETITPVNNSSFKIEKGKLPNFTWKWNGSFPPPKTYYLEVFQIDSSATKAIFSKTVDAFSLSADAVFGSKPSVGIYKWQVTDTLTGQQSEPSFFTLTDASCGTVSASIKAVCKDWTPNGLPIYSVTLSITNTSTSGTLGCAVKYNVIIPQPLTGTSALLSPALPITIPANGTQSFTFTFIPVNLYQTNIVMLCFGNWQDAFMNTAHLSITGKLPPCICNECKDVNSINLIVTPDPNKPGVFNLSGDLTTVGIPAQIDAVEFQIKSFKFTATPYSCTNGITSVENSGFFLNPASTINSSSVLVFFNESVSPPSPPTNNNATKDIKWIGGPLPVGPPIPFNLTIGMPSPLTGMNADCCKLKYKVCIKATLFYGNKCRLCTTTFCKDFSN